MKCTEKGNYNQGYIIIWDRHNLFKGEAYLMIITIKREAWEKNPNHDSRKLKFAIFENFTNHGESIRDIYQGSRELKNTPITDHGEKMVREKKKCMRGSEKGSEGQMQLQYF